LKYHYKQWKKNKSCKEAIHESRARLLLEVSPHVPRSLAMLYTSIANMSALKLPLQAHQSVPSSKPMIYSYMDPNNIPDISPTITHNGVLTVPEVNAQLEDLAPYQEMQMQQ
jgi:hypothetical protein